MFIGDYDFSMKILTSSVLTGYRSTDPDVFIDEYGGRIYGNRFDHDDECVLQRRAGRFLGYRIQVGLARNNKESLFQVCDCHSQAMFDLYDALFLPGSADFKPSVLKRVGGDQGCGLDVFWLDEVVIAKKWADTLLDLAVITRAFDMLAGDCGLHVLSAEKKLWKRYTKLGFVGLPRTDLMLRSPAYVHPGMDKVEKWLTHTEEVA